MPLGDIRDKDDIFKKKAVTLFPERSLFSVS